jgi:hypothetical protein
VYSHKYFAILLKNTNIKIEVTPIQHANIRGAKYFAGTESKGEDNV